MAFRNKSALKLQSSGLSGSIHSTSRPSSFWRGTCTFEDCKVTQSTSFLNLVRKSRMQESPVWRMCSSISVVLRPQLFNIYTSNSATSYKQSMSGIPPAWLDLFWNEMCSRFIFLALISCQSLLQVIAGELMICAGLVVPLLVLYWRATLRKSPLMPT